MTDRSELKGMGAHGPKLPMPSPLLGDRSLGLAVPSRATLAAPGPTRLICRTALATVVTILVLLATSCSSPNRGHWTGTFDGSVSGTVEFEINARGTKVKGRMTGETADGQPFRATLEGILRQDYFRADFEGRAGGSLGLPVPFTGEMTGSLDLGVGHGDWSCTLWRNSGHLQGTWSVEQTDT